MPTRLLSAVLLVAAAQATAQTSSTYRFHASPAVLAPGQTALITIRVDMDPDIGASVSSGTVLGLSSGAFSLTAMGAASGTWSNLACDAPYNGTGSNAGTAAGSNVTNIVWRTETLLMPLHPSPFNPDLVWTGSFTAGATPGPVSFTIIPLLPTKVWTAGPLAPVEFDFSAGFNDPQVLTILPAPGPLAALGLGVLLAARRRR